MNTRATRTYDRSARSALAAVALLALLAPARAGATPTPPFSLSPGSLSPGACRRTSIPKANTPPALLAIVAGEPGSCAPPCRTGFACKRGKCVSLCNPPCPAGQRCTASGECEPLPQAGEPTRRRYFALLGGTRIGLNDSAATFGELRAEVGSRWISFQIGGGFGSHATNIRAALVGHVSFRPFSRWPLWLQPRLALGFGYNWKDDTAKTRQSQLFVTPGLRLRLDVARKLAIFLDAIQLEINYLRLQSNDRDNVARARVAPVLWGIHAGVAFVY